MRIREVGLTSVGRFLHKPVFERINTIEQIEKADHYFDGIVCSSVLEYVDNPRRCVEEFARVLRPGGHLLLTVPNRASLMRKLEAGIWRLTNRLWREPWPAYLKFSRHHYRCNEITALLAASGFQVKTVEFFGPVWPPRINRLQAIGMLMALLALKTELQASNRQPGPRE
jgi:2-polyprenyl-6-hydroxyphenyl methylase/3-demethylubiquinone-9 3-methyltransferase